VANPRGTFNVKVDTKLVREALANKVPSEYESRRGVMLRQMMDGVIANIRRRQIWPNETVGILKRGLWAGDPYFTGGGLAIDGGWSGEGAAFGPGHEYGFKKSKWSIKPVNVRTSTKHTSNRIGQPIKMLRFKAGGRVIYARDVVVSAPSELKPHWAPALKAYPVDAKMGKAIDGAIARAGLK